MKTLHFLAASIVAALLTGCSDPNRPVQTAHDLPDSMMIEETPGATPLKADSVTSTKGPDQMIPENSGPDTSRMPHNK